MARAAARLFAANSAMIGRFWGLEKSFGDLSIRRKYAAIVGTL
jgi:hypothetical protein